MSSGGEGFIEHWALSIFHLSLESTGSARPEVLDAPFQSGVLPPEGAEGGVPWGRAASEH
ncbi:hypothetical protein SBV1_820013 [Verrucomicrobia bacterium]|nr:hypothetical protein SBV1_820013 [Verrucomicrobiota bacterium]